MLFWSRMNFTQILKSMLIYFGTYYLLACTQSDNYSVVVTDKPTPATLYEKCQQIANENPEKYFKKSFNLSFAEPPILKTEYVSSTRYDFRCEDWQDKSVSQVKALNNFLRAKVEQENTIELEDNAYLCDIKMTNLSEGTFNFDDHVYLTMNDKILVSSYLDNDLKSRMTPEQVSLDDAEWTQYQWNWQTFFDDSNTALVSNVNNMNYCIGAGESNVISECTIPGTQSYSTLNLQIDPKIIISIGLSAEKPSLQKFKFITLGDNDPGIDCKHSALNYQIEVSYILIQ